MFNKRLLAAIATGWEGGYTASLSSAHAQVKRGGASVP